MKHAGNIIYNQRDEFGLVQVVEDATTRKLFFDSAIEQSCQYINAPLTLNFEYQQKMVALLLDFAARLRRAPRILMLGLGGGSIANQLHQCLPKSNITVVELRQTVIDCAYRFFQLPQTPEIEVLHDDAVHFVRHCAELDQNTAEKDDNSHQFDAIIVDIFDADGLASELNEAMFNDHLWQLLNEQQGILLFNLWQQWQNSDVQNKQKPKPTADSQQILDYWQKHINQQSGWQLNRYNIHSSQNLIVEISRC